MVEHVITIPMFDSDLVVVTLGLLSFLIIAKVIGWFIQVLPG